MGNPLNTVRAFISSHLLPISFGTATSQNKPTLFGVPQGSVIGPTLYLLYTMDIPQLPSVTTSLYADDTGNVAHDADYDTAVAKLQSAVDSVAKWAKKWKIRINESKSVRVDFSLRPHAHDPTILDGSAVPVANSARYLGLHLDNKLNWSEHIRQKRVILDLLRFKFNWLLYSRQLSLHNKRLIYTSIFRPAWSYGAEIWGVAAASNIAVLERFQNKFLRSIARAPWFISNEQLQNELDIEPVQSVIMKRATHYVSPLHQHPNTEAIQLLDDTNDTTRLQRKKLSNLLHWIAESLVYILFPHHLNFNFDEQT